MSQPGPAAAPLRVGLVGANWGLTHLAAWRAVPGVDVVAVCTGHRDSAARVAAEHRVGTAYWDAADLIADPRLDVVDVTIRPALRTEMAPAAIRAGKHLMVPLPFATDDRAARALDELARRHGVVAVVENLHRHEPALRQLRDLVTAGELGRVSMIRGHVRSDLLLNPPDPWPYEWILDPVNHASALRNFGAHLLHAVVDLAGPVAAVAATLRRDTREVRLVGGRRVGCGVVDGAALLLRTVAGADVALDVSWCAPAAEGFAVEVVGDRGRARVTAERLGPQHARLERAGPSDAAMTPAVIEQRYRTIPGVPGVEPDPLRPQLFPMVAMCQRFATAVRGDGDGAAPTFAEAAHVSAVVESAYDADARRTWVDVPR